jgi:uncharacterized protein with PQ loop repeat
MEGGWYLGFDSDEGALAFCLYMCRPTFWRIIKNKDVEEFKSDPYLATLLNCMLWVFYGILCIIFSSAMYAFPLTIMVRTHRFRS